MLALVLIAVPAELPALAEGNRFPSLFATEAQLGALIRVRYVLRQAMPSRERDAALAYNTTQLAAWEALLEDRGGLVEEEGGRDDEEMCRWALGRLRMVIGEERLASPTFYTFTSRPSISRIGIQKTCFWASGTGWPSRSNRRTCCNHRRGICGSSVTPGARTGSRPAASCTHRLVGRVCPRYYGHRDRRRRCPGGSGEPNNEANLARQRSRQGERPPERHDSRRIRLPRA